MSNSWEFFDKQSDKVERVLKKIIAEENQIIIHNKEK